MLPTNLINLLAVCLLSYNTSSVAALHTARNPSDALRILSRQSGQCQEGSSPCNKAGLPANFCCPSGQQCIAFNNDKSAICCPKGQDCKKIAPINCDISKQNAATSPGSGIHSTELTGKLETCGSNCCPKGYSCQNGNCVLQTSSSSSSSSSKASSTASSTTSSTSTTASPTKSALPVSNTTTTAEHCEKFPAGAVAAGVFSGILLGIIFTIAAILIIGRRNRKKSSESYNESKLGSVGPPSISDPIPPQNGELRNDFLRHDPFPSEANAHTGYSRSRASSRVRSLFARSPTNNRHSLRSPTSPDGIDHRLQSPMQTPLRREPSMESIKIYSPPNGGLTGDNVSERRPGTTFSGM